MSITDAALVEMLKKQLAESIGRGEIKGEMKDLQKALHETLKKNEIKEEIAKVRNLHQKDELAQDMLGRCEQNLMDGNPVCEQTRISTKLR